MDIRALAYNNQQNIEEIPYMTTDEGLEDENNPKTFTDTDYQRLLAQFCGPPMQELVETDETGKNFTRPLAGVTASVV